MILRLNNRASFGIFRLSILLSSAWVGAGCSGADPAPGTNAHPEQRVAGQSDFVSALPNSNGSSVEDSAGQTPTGGKGTTNATATRQVEETDLYRLEGDRLYYLNGYRGLLVFDVS